MKHGSEPHLADFVLDTSGTLNTHSAFDVIAGSDSNCDSCNSVVGDIGLVASAPYTTHKRISGCKLKPLSHSLPALLTQDDSVFTSSIPCTVLLHSSSQSLPNDGISACTEVPSSEVSTMVVGDSRVPGGRETSVSSSRRHRRMSGVETVGELNVAFEPFCRICQLSGDSDSSMISPCRCAGSLQYTHTACLVVSVAQCCHQHSLTACIDSLFWGYTTSL